MAKKKKINERQQWVTVFFGLFVFLGLGIGLITAYHAGATDQMHAMQDVKVTKR